MQNNRLTKISILIITLALCICAVFAMSVSAEEASATKPEIISQNVMYTDQFCLMYAVDASAAAPITLNVYRAVPDAETPVEKSYVVEKATSGTESGLGKDAYIFTVQGVWANELLDEYYVQAVDANGNKSELKRYSVAEYLYQRLASDRVTEDQKAFYNATLKFGADAQTLFAPEGTTPDLITDYRYVTVSGGTINDYINESGIYLLGETITLRVPDAITSQWNVSITNADGIISTSETNDKYVVTDAVKTEFDLVSTKAYRPQANTFEEFTEDDTCKFFSTEKLSGGYINDFGYAYEEGHGMIIKASMGSALLMRSGFDTSIATKDTATAFEFSFDIKIEFLEDKAGYREYILPGIRYSGSNFTTRKSLGRDLTGNYLCFLGSGGGSPFAKFEDVDCSDWFHVRMVYYAGDTTRYIYVNGSETPIKMTADTGSYSGDIKTISRAEFYLEKDYSDLVISLDNVFCGYTMDTLPVAE